MDITDSARPDEHAAAVIPTLRCVLVPTDDGDEQLDATRRLATRLAADHDWRLVLYDRSDERWTDTPHPSGPHDADELERRGDRPHLVRQLRDIDAAGVSATAWLATVPSITAMIDALQGMDVDGVLLPREPDRRTVMDRLLEGDDIASTVERVAELQLDREPVFLVVDDDGTITHERYEGATSP